MAPYVPSPQEIIDRMLEIAQARQGDTVIDVGCGDGRILITAVQKFRAKAVGIEIDSKIAAQASDTILKLGLQNKARVVRADVFDADLSHADVVTLYLTTSFNEKLRPKFEKSLKPGTRVVSHDYGIRGWNPVEVEEVFVHGRRHRIFLYVVDGKKN
jgi:cyclopropane fatty-acyl-phospholipid synthase-like methyltransferase